MFLFSHAVCVFFSLSEGHIHLADVYCFIGVVFFVRWCCLKWDFRWFVRLKCFELKWIWHTRYYLFGLSNKQRKTVWSNGKEDNSTFRMNLTYVRCSSVERMFAINRSGQTAYNDQNVEHIKFIVGHVRATWNCLNVLFCCCCFFLNDLLLVHQTELHRKRCDFVVFGSNQKRHHTTIGERKIAFESKTR